MTYVDKKPGFRRSYTLRGDVLSIDGRRWLGGSFHQEFSLKKVKPEPDEHHLKDDTTSALVGLPGLAVFVISVLAGATIYEKTPGGFYALLGLGLAAMLIGFVLGGRMRVRVFKSHDDVPLFDVASRGNRLADFEAFTTELTTRIRAANSGGTTK